MRCCNCDINVSFSNWGNIRDINNKSIPCCRECSSIVLEKLKRNRFIETYNGNDIYLYKGNYYPYWGCNYSFSNIEDCRARIDMKGVSIIPTELLIRVMRGESLF